jgi:hypothetical protein
MKKKINDQTTKPQSPPTTRVLCVANPQGGTNLVDSFNEKIIIKRDEILVEDKNDDVRPVVSIRETPVKESRDRL